MSSRTAECSCGSLRAVCQGEPARISVCHCLDCQRRTGSAFALNATFEAGQVDVSGPYSTFTRSSDEGYWGRFNFCPVCGSNVFYEIERRPGMISVPVGGFADPGFPVPTVSVYEERRHPWCSIEAEGLVRID